MGDNAGGLGYYFARGHAMSIQMREHSRLTIENDLWLTDGMTLILGPNAQLSLGDN